MTSASNTTTETPKATAICAHFDLGDDGRELLHPDDSADYFLTALTENRLYTDAIRFTAHRLSKREAVWWGCLCAWEVCRPKPAHVVSQALKACTAWVREPNEENRRAAEASSDPALGTPAGNLALAVFVSGGSISGPKLPPVAPGPHLTAKLVAEAILLASRIGAPRATADCQRRFLGIASDIATGKVPVGTKPGA